MPHRKIGHLILLAVLASSPALMRAGIGYSPAPSPTYPQVQDLPAPKQGTNPKGMEEPNKERKTNACYIKVNPPSGCYYPELHEEGETCYCSKEQTNYEGRFLVH